MPSFTVRAASRSGFPGTLEWRTFLRRHVSAEGRVVDNGKGDISHSEGQGIGLLSAACFGSQADFDLILGWTQRHLRRGYDVLYSWCFHPNVGNAVPDENNATDGDLLIGYALLLAADRWQDRTYLARGTAIAHAVRGALLRKTASGTVLLPAVDGFEDAGGLTFNPSYYIFPALRRFAKQFPDPVWERAWSDGLELLTRARFGRWGLPPDWGYLARAGNTVTIAATRPPRCSFDAVRLPLYLCWASLQDHPVVTAFATYWARNGGALAPAWSDLETSAAAPYSLTAGMDAIRRMVNFKIGYSAECILPTVASTSDYYAAALIMLVHVAMEGPPGPTS